MKKLVASFIFLMAVLLQLSAQNIEEWVAAKKPLLFEKLYVHVDRELYAPGDKIWLKVYQVNGITHQLNSNYRNVSVQLVAESGDVMKELLLFTIKGQAEGQIGLDSIASGMYTIRATTRYLENFSEEAAIHKKIRISGRAQNGKSANQAATDYLKASVAFLPESGSLILNAVNTVAFKAIDQKGRGISVKGKILDDLGDTITTFSTSYLGMGKFLMMPVEGRSYHAVLDSAPDRKFTLDAARSDGICLNYRDNGESLLFTMAGDMNRQSFPSFYFVASHKGIVLFYKKIEMSGFSQLLNLRKNLFPKGISKISLLDAAFKPFSERLIFIDDGAPDLIKLNLPKAEFSPREVVNISAEAELLPGDSINSPLSVAVVNKNYFGVGGSSQNIKSYLLLDSELKGSIESPASYFVDDELITSGQKLDLLMMVHGWRSYLWDDVEAVKTPFLEDWNDAGIEIGGYVKKLLWKAPQPNVLLTLSSAGGSFTIERTRSDTLGRFSFKRVYLSNITRVMINALTKNGTRNAEIKLNPKLKLDTVLNVGPVAQFTPDVEVTQNFDRINSFRLMKERDFEPEKGTILLDDVDVFEKRKVKDDGHFRVYSNPDKSMTISNEDLQYQNIFDYLEGRVPGLVITGDQISMRGGGMPLFMIDGMEVSGFMDGDEGIIREIRNLRMNEIDKVEILKNGANLALFGSKGGNGVIAIYRKTLSSATYADNYTNGRVETSIRGFHKAPKFYSPEYLPDNINNPQPDYRPTLFWNPELKFDAGKSKIGFFTSDELANYVVFVEGITKNGKICFGTASFSVDKK
jgi:hypothetical protein